MNMQTYHGIYFYAENTLSANLNQNSKIVFQTKIWYKD